MASWERGGPSNVRAGKDARAPGRPCPRERVGEVTASWERGLPARERAGSVSPAVSGPAPPSARSGLRASSGVSSRLARSSSSAKSRPTPRRRCWSARSAASSPAGMTRLIRPLTMIATSSAMAVATPMFCSMRRMATSPSAARDESSSSSWATMRGRAPRSARRAPAAAGPGGGRARWRASAARRPRAARPRCAAARQAAGTRRTPAPRSTSRPRARRGAGARPR